MTFEKENLTIELHNDEESRGYVDNGTYEVEITDVVIKKAKNPESSFATYLEADCTVVGKAVHFTHLATLVPGEKFADTRQFLEKFGLDVTGAKVDLASLKGKKAKVYLVHQKNFWGRQENKMVL